uniref:Uncharacterized protein n=1 Tax=Arion vulgaris TaxID=1028688 RepID=A0A0B7B8Y0_9EUPU
MELMCNIVHPLYGLFMNAKDVQVSFDTEWSLVSTKMKTACSRVLQTKFTALKK